MSGTRVKKTERAKIARLYRSGLSVAAVAEKVERDEETVRRQLLAADEPLRGQSMADIPVAEAVAMYDERKLSVRAIAAHFKVGYGTVHRLLDANTTLRPRRSPTVSRPQPRTPAAD
jgi:IS30 family transposase